MEDQKPEEGFESEVLLKSESQNGKHETKRKRSRSPMRRSRSRSRSPRNWRRGERNRDREDRGPKKPMREGPNGKVRLYVCNMPYDMKWQDLKDLFKNEVGSSVTYVELYENLNGKPSGAGAVEIRGLEQAEQALEKMDRFDINGRKIVVREERDMDRARHKVTLREDRMSGGGNDMGYSGGGMGSGMGGGGMGNSMMGGGGNMGGGNNLGMGGGTNLGMGGGNNLGMGGGNNLGMGGGSNVGMGGGASNVHGISPQILQQLNIDPSHVTNQVFVANLDYKVTDRKVREIFKMAGNIVDVDFKVDEDGKSRGMCVLRFEHPVEAVQAVSMFNGQVLYDRTMTVKMDKMGDASYSPQQIPNKLPSGLKSIGMGLGSGGTPVNVQAMQNLNNIGGNTGGSMGNNMMGNMSAMSGNMGTGMNTGMGGLGTMGTMGTSMGNMGMGNMGMGNLGGGGMGSTMGGSGGMGGGDISSLTGSNLGGMGMRNNLNTVGMGGMGTGMNNLGAGMGNMGGTDLGNTMGMGGGMGGMGSMGGLNTMGAGTGLGGGTMGSGNSLGGGGMGGSMDNFNWSGGNMGNSGGGGGSSSSGREMESTTVFVRNIPFSFSWQDLKSKFSKCGEVKYAELKMENGKSKGFGTVKFITSDDARRAVNLMNGARIDGRQIEVRLNRV